MVEWCDKDNQAASFVGASMLSVTFTPTRYDIFRFRLHFSLFSLRSNVARLIVILGFAALSAYSVSVEPGDFWNLTLFGQIFGFVGVQFLFLIALLIAQFLLLVVGVLLTGKASLLPSTVTLSDDAFVDENSQKRTELKWRSIQKVTRP